MDHLRVSAGVSPAPAGGGSPLPPLRVVVAFDGRAGSDDALAFACALADATPTELTVASIRPYWRELVGDEAYDRAMSADERWIAQEAARTLAGRPFAPVALPGGRRPNGIGELAATSAADMIVVGSSREAPSGGARLGVDSARIFEGAPCPVVVIPRGTAATGPSLESIAVGVDGSRGAGLAVDWAASLAARLRAGLLLLAIVDIPPAARDDRGGPATAERDRMRAALSRARDSLAGAGRVAAETRLISGRPAASLVEAAAGDGLLVVGSRGGFGSSGHVALGEVAAAVTRGARCATAITPAT